MKNSNYIYNQLTNEVDKTISPGDYLTTKTTDMPNSQTHAHTGKIANIFSEILSRQKTHSAFLSGIAHRDTDHEYAHCSVNSDGSAKGKASSIGGKA